MREGEAGEAADPCRLSSSCPSLAIESGQEGETPTPRRRGRGPQFGGKGGRGGHRKARGGRARSPRYVPLTPLLILTYNYNIFLPLLTLLFSVRALERVRTRVVMVRAVGATSTRAGTRPNTMVTATMEATMGATMGATTGGTSPRRSTSLSPLPAWPSPTWPPMGHPQNPGDTKPPRLSKPPMHLDKLIIPNKPYSYQKAL